MTTRRVALLIVAVAAACKGPEPSSAAQLTDVSRPTSASVSEGRPTAITRAVERGAPAVVTVQTEARERVQQDPMFDWFFGQLSSSSRLVPGIGTGFIVGSDGVIVTKAHVVANAQKVSVMRRDGTVYPAQILGTDET